MLKGQNPGQTHIIAGTFTDRMYNKLDLMKKIKTLFPEVKNDVSS